jgi:hypothetical protein
MTKPSNKNLIIEPKLQNDKITRKWQTLTLQEVFSNMALIEKSTNLISRHALALDGLFIKANTLDIKL